MLHRCLLRSCKAQQRDPHATSSPAAPSPASCAASIPASTNCCLAQSCEAKAHKLSATASCNFAGCDASARDKSAVRAAVYKQTVTVASVTQDTSVTPDSLLLGHRRCDLVALLGGVACEVITMGDVGQLELLNMLVHMMNISEVQFPNLLSKGCQGGGAQQLRTSTRTTHSALASQR